VAHSSARPPGGNSPRRSKFSEIPEIRTLAREIRQEAHCVRVGTSRRPMRASDARTERMPASLFPRHPATHPSSPLAIRRHGFPRSHGPAEHIVNQPTVNIRLTSPRAGGCGLARAATPPRQRRSPAKQWPAGKFAACPAIRRSGCARLEATSGRSRRGRHPVDPWNNAAASDTQKHHAPGIMRWPARPMLVYFPING
jgi:hypothetical protein